MSSDSNQPREFTQKENEIINVLTKAGLKRNYARVLVFLFQDRDLTSREIERGTDLRQPEVSIAINFLIKKRWVEVTRLITENKGRPVKLYRLGTSVDAILNEFEDGKNKEYLKQVEFLEKVRGMIKDAFPSYDSQDSMP